MLKAIFIVLIYLGLRFILSHLPDIPSWLAVFMIAILGFVAGFFCGIGNGYRLGRYDK